jgi:hypothetical protein
MGAPRGSAQDRFRRREVERSLDADLQTAQERYRNAVRRVQEIINRVPSGIPAPDSDLRITQAARERALAYAALQVAVQRWKDFVGKGIVPAGLKNEGASTPTGE